MRIAIIGWGSLIWDPGPLEIDGEWSADGPELPIDFCRLSGGHRLTLAIHPGAAAVRTHWAPSAHDDLVKASKNLRQREKTFPEHIHHTSPEDTHKSCRPEVLSAVRAWLATRSGLDAAVWTGLETNWAARRGRPFEIEDAVRYLLDLERKGLADAAREYILRAPANSRNATWTALTERLGWTAE